ncbi:MAG: sigma 54-interacting transcriptional regulator, partial [Planctomycetes bacterium]|nr:sigma 54-interacting transcriptional regulator [Planctomycetota bacterium]
MKNEEVALILDSIADGVFTVDKDWKITSFNRAAEEITGTSAEKALGNYCKDIFRTNICDNDCPLKKSIDTGLPIHNKTVMIKNVMGENVPISISTAVLKSNKGTVLGGVETFRDMSIVEELMKKISGQHVLEDIVSKNDIMQDIFKILPDIAQSASTVLIEGESGTGKELFAQAIHNLSPRKKKPFVAINCGAFPDTLLDSELFGHKAGAFTDAKSDKLGRFALAEGGTLFLDEIGDLSPPFQALLLRVLQERQYVPVGGTQSIKTNVRVIAATNKYLHNLVKNEVFREDLYYRVNVVRIEIPPLRKRSEDIPLLVQTFIK